MGSSLQEAAPLAAGQTQSWASGLYAGVRAGKTLSLFLCKPVPTLLLTKCVRKGLWVKLELPPLSHLP